MQLINEVAVKTFVGDTSVERVVSTESIVVYGIVIAATSTGGIEFQDNDGNNYLRMGGTLGNFMNHEFRTPFLAENGLKFSATAPATTQSVTVFYSQAGV